MLHHKVNSETEKVKSFFDSVERFAEIHPLIQCATLTAPQEYIIRERMAFSFFRFNYKAIVSTYLDKEVQYIAYPFFLVLTIKFQFTPSTTQNSTLITEYVHIDGPFIFAQVLKSAVTYSHKKVIKKLKKMLE